MNFDANLARKLRMRVILRVLAPGVTTSRYRPALFALFLLDKIIYRVLVGAESVACDAGNIIVTLISWANPIKCIFVH